MSAVEFVISGDDTHQKSPNGEVFLCLRVVVSVYHPSEISHLFTQPRQVQMRVVYVLSLLTIKGLVAPVEEAIQVISD